MKSFLLTLALVLSFSPTAGAQDLDKGLEAFKRADYATALREFRPLAKQGNAGAQFNIGFMYWTGEGVPQDQAEAEKWYRNAADQGYAKAQDFLGYMYQHGEVVPQDYAEAEKWYRKAADQGYAEAMLNLGYMYARGRGIPEDYTEAYIWYSLAAAGGYETAPFRRKQAAKRLSPDQLRDAQREARKRWDRIQARKK